MTKKNIITFEAQNNTVFHVYEKPIPAAKAIPNWWKEIPKYGGDFNKLEMNPAPNVTVKQCAPTLDMFTSGYIVTLWADIFVKQTEFGPYVSWNPDLPQIIEFWPSNQVNNFEIPEGFSNIVFKYLHGWNIITSPGWSCLFIHPSAYQNLPIRSISGIVDTDILKTKINCPFFIKNNFEGIIKKGTPMFQVIPFKRESWESNFTNPGEEKHKIETQKLYTKLIGAYSSKKAKKYFK